MLIVKKIYPSQEMVWAWRAPGTWGTCPCCGRPHPPRASWWPRPPWWGPAGVSWGQARDQYNKCVYLGAEPRHPVSREDMEWRKSAGSDVAGYWHLRTAIILATSRFNCTTWRTEIIDMCAWIRSCPNEKVIKFNYFSLLHRKLH